MAFLLVNLPVWHHHPPGKFNALQQPSGRSTDKEKKNPDTQILTQGSFGYSEKLEIPDTKHGFGCRHELFLVVIEVDWLH